MLFFFKFSNWGFWIWFCLGLLFLFINTWNFRFYCFLFNLCSIYLIKFFHFVFIFFVSYFNINIKYYVLIFCFNFYSFFPFFKFLKDNFFFSLNRAMFRAVFKLIQFFLRFWLLLKFANELEKNNKNNRLPKIHFFHYFQSNLIFV